MKRCKRSSTEVINILRVILVRVLVASLNFIFHAIEQKEVVIAVICSMHEVLLLLVWMLFVQYHVHSFVVTTGPSADRVFHSLGMQLQFVYLLVKALLLLPMILRHEVLNGLLAARNNKRVVWVLRRLALLANPVRRNIHVVNTILEFGGHVGTMLNKRLLDLGLIVDLNLLLDFDGNQIGGEHLDKLVLVDAECFNSFYRRVQELCAFVENA